jgi:acetyl esterase
MSPDAPLLPGKLGKPDLTLSADPRLDPRLVALFSPGEAMDNLIEDSTSVDRNSSYEEALQYVEGIEPNLGPFYDGPLFGSLPPVEGVTRRTQTIVDSDDHEITLYIHEPTERAGPLPGVVHTHGGGMVMSSATDLRYERWRDELAATGLCVVGVEFRNAAGKLGNHPFPAGLNDCARATQWTYFNRSELGISIVIVSGESGGGNLCLAVALKAKQEEWLDEIGGVYSCCPYISGTYDPAPPELTSLFENKDYVIDASTQAMVKAYDPTGEHAKNPLAWPYHATNSHLEGLPPHTVSVNELDPLRDEGLAYARKLARAGVQTISRTVNATPHGGDTDFLLLIPEIYYATIRDIHGFANSIVNN